MAADALPADRAVPMPAPAPVPQIVVAACTGGSCSEQSVHQGGRCAEIRIQHELLWLQISNDGTRRHVRTLNNVARDWRVVLAEDEETKFRIGSSEASC